MRVKQTILFFAAASILAANASALTIDFDDIDAWSWFHDDGLLTDHYFDMGVRFRGGSDGGPGGQVLNDNFLLGIEARSGANFLAFGIDTGNEEIISFASTQRYVSIWGASPAGGSFTMNAYDADFVLIDSVKTLFSPSWAQLSVKGDNIKYVELIGNGLAYVYDDLEISAVPEPSTWAMFLVGIGATGSLIRRRNCV